MILLEQNFAEKEVEDKDFLYALEKTAGLSQRRTVARAIIYGQDIAREFGGRFIIEEKDGEILFSIAKNLK